MKFVDHKYTCSIRHKTTTHSWGFRGPTGGLEFNVSITETEDNPFGPSCGLEFHHSFDPSGGKDAPHHKDCHLIGGNCWHDGTSMYASEHVWPIVKSMMPDQHAIFRYLEGEYNRHFDKFSDPQDV